MKTNHDLEAAADVCEEHGGMGMASHLLRLLAARFSTGEYNDSQACFLGAVMALSHSEPLADPTVCEHRIKVAVNAKTNVCAVCRATFEERTDFGIFVSGPPREAPRGLQGSFGDHTNETYRCDTCGKER